MLDIIKYLKKQKSLIMEYFDPLRIQDSVNETCHSEMPY